MNTEPVAWMEYIQGVEWEIWFVEPTNLPDGHTYKPLYTHPAKTLTDDPLVNFKPVWQEKPELTLTNEEILQANLEFGKENGEDYSMLTIEDIEPLIGLVKFILRKAQE